MNARIIYRDEDCVIVCVGENELVVFIIKRHGEQIVFKAISANAKKEYSFTVTNYCEIINACGDEDQFWLEFVKRFYKDMLDQ